jgi:hypothetical protein
VDHGRSGSDDYANAVAGVLYQLARGGYPSDLSWVSDDADDPVAASAAAARSFAQYRLARHIYAGSGWLGGYWR